MRKSVRENTISVWANENDTYNWAYDTWPGSTLGGRRFFAQFDRNGLCDVTVDGKSDVEIDAHELSCCVADLLRCKLPKNHPLYDVVVSC